VSGNSLESFDDNEDDVQSLIKIASQTNDEIKIKVKEYKIQNPYDD